MLAKSPPARLPVSSRRALPSSSARPMARTAVDQPLCSRYEITVRPANAPVETLFPIVTYAAGTVAASKNKA